MNWAEVRKEIEAWIAKWGLLHPSGMLAAALAEIDRLEADLLAANVAMASMRKNESVSADSHTCYSHEAVKAVINLFRRVDAIEANCELANRVTALESQISLIVDGFLSISREVAKREP